MNFFADIVERVAPAVVHIRVLGMQATPFGPMQSMAGGSGVLVAPGNGLVLTNAHVVANASSGARVKVKQFCRSF